MKNHEYKTIVFDLGNVLIPFDHSLWVKNFNEIEAGLGDKYYQLYLDNYHVHRDYESGKISDAEFVSINLKWLDNKVDTEIFFDVFSNIFVLNQNVIDLLPILKKKYKLVLLSNTSDIHKKYGWEQYNFIKQFDKLILSQEVKSVKPEEIIYKAAESFTKEPSETHIFIDDVLEYVNAAKSLGWDGIQFVGYDNLVKELKHRNIL
jgi:glucose-1-phosphatase